MTDTRAALRFSVRTVAAFAGGPEDILPGAMARQMLEGALAHQAFQRALPEGAQAEAPLSATFCRLGETVTLQGRADALSVADALCPALTEVKHPAGGVAPEEAHPEHAAQALLYAFLLTCAGAERVRFTVCYVTLAGEPMRAFERSLSREEICAEVYPLLDLCIAWEASERDHRAARDASIRALPFPFPTYRAGQRELAAQVYTAITKRRRLFASLPTGTGKSAATLFPALKALALGKTRRVLYLTARTTARQSPVETLRRMTEQGLRARVLTLTSKEKLCPGYGLRCHPDTCPRARGHYTREQAAVEEMRRAPLWTEDALRAAAERHSLCPFEFAMTLSLLADVVVMDYNFAFDPVARIQRLTNQPSASTFLIDEAHHLPERGRGMLSGALSSGDMKRLRAAVGREIGRKHPLWRALGDCAKALDALRAGEDARDARDAVSGQDAANGRDAADAQNAVNGQIAPNAQDAANGQIAPNAQDAANGQIAPNAHTAANERIATNAHTASNSQTASTESPAPLETVYPTATSASAIPSAFSASDTLPASPASPDPSPPPAPDTLPRLPVALVLAASSLCAQTADAMTLPLSGDTRSALIALLRDLMGFTFAADRARETPRDYALLVSSGGKDTRLSLYCLLPAPWLRERTRRAAGAVFFSATMTPLQAMKEVLGGEDADACFALPSPFPPERLLVMVSPRDTRYRERGRTAGDVARDILSAARARSGKYIAYFPSYAYLRLILSEIEQMEAPPLCVQSRDMDEAAREAFLARFTDDDTPLLGLCVLGGAFAEGVDLPDGRLIGVMIVGVGLATPSRETEALRARYAEMGLDGFAYAFQYPAMHKVLQAAGRVIRSETDAGVVLLIDDRYRRRDYRALCPDGWQMASGDVAARVRAFSETIAPRGAADNETEEMPV